MILLFLLIVFFPLAPSKVTLFSGSEGRESVDTWFEVDLPFEIEPAKECLKPQETRTFKVTFSPLDAFDFKVKLKSTIGNIMKSKYKINYITI